MAAIANLVLADGLATPVNHTFSPVGVKNGIASYADRVGGIQVGYWTVSSFFRWATKASKTNKFTSKIVVPVMDITSQSTTSGIAPAPTKAYECLISIDVVMPERATQTDRDHVAALIKNWTAHAVFQNSIKTLDVTF